MSEKGAIQRGKKWAFMMSISESLKDDVLESMKKNSAMQKDYDLYLASVNIKKKK